MKILVVDDDVIGRTLLVRMLRDYGNCLEVGNGKEALTILEEALAKNDRFDLVFLDIMMPGMNGQELLQRLRKMEKDEGIEGPKVTKVIMTTALDDTKSIMDALARGRCEGYLIKPIKRAHLVQELTLLQLQPIQ